MKKLIIIIGVSVGVLLVILFLPPIKGYTLPGEIVMVDTTGLNKLLLVPKSIKTDITLEEICTTVTNKLRAGENETITIDPQTDVIYEGSVLKASSLQSGEFTEITGGKRKPITISISVSGRDSVSAKIRDPILSTVREAKNRILLRETVGVEPAAFAVKDHQIYSKEHLKIIFKSKFSSSFGKIEAGFDFDDTTVRSRYVMDLTQVYYSMDVDAPGKRGFFDAKPDNLESFSPVYISSLKYGKRLLVFIESKENVNNKGAFFNGQFKALIKKGSFNTEAFESNILKDNSVRILAIGGNPANPYQIFATISEGKDFHEFLVRDSIWSLKNQGAMIAYTVRHCSDPSVFKLTQYGEFEARSCVIKPKGEFPIASVTLANLCPSWFSGDREFKGHGPMTTFDVKLSHKGNDIFANFDCTWQEGRPDKDKAGKINDQGDKTAGYYKNSILIARIPDSLSLLNILSPTKMEPWVYTDENGHEIEGSTFDNKNSPVQSVTIMGDTDSDNDLSSDCNSYMNTGILNVKFYPIIAEVRKSK